MYFKNLFTQKAYSLCFPDQYKDDTDRLVLHNARTANAKEAPFATKLDLWLYCVIFASATDLKVEEGDYRKFVDTRSVDIKPYYCGLLAVVSLDYNLRHGNEFTEDPKEIIDLANQLACAAMPKIIDHIKNNELCELDSFHELSQRTLNDTVGHDTLYRM